VLALALLALGVVTVAWIGLTHGAPSSGTVPALVALPDANGNGVPDAVENSILGTDPTQASAAALPDAWVRAWRLDISDPDLASRAAPYPTPPASPAVYGPAGLPAEFRMSLAQVYAYGRPATWNESRDGAWNSSLDPTRQDLNGTGVPYAWLIHFGLDPRAPGVLDVVPAGASVTWTPREAYQRGLSPLEPDQDHDGLADVTELKVGTSPRLFSTTGSGIADGWLQCHGFDPLDPAVAYQDPARSGMTLREKFLASMRLDPAGTLACRGGLDPRAQSTGGSGIPDGWLAKYGLDPRDPRVGQRVVERENLTENGTRVEETLNVLQKYAVNRPPLWNETINGPWWGGADPTTNDTAHSGLTDLQKIHGWVIEVAGKPKWVFADPTKVDSDADGLTDKQEFDGRAGNLTFPLTDPLNPDTDGDGLTDGQEAGAAAWHDITLPHTDPTLVDTSGDGLSDGEKAAYWAQREADCLADAPYPWGIGHKTIAEALRVAWPLVPADRVCAALGPGGSFVVGGRPNMLNPDVDGDGLLNGWEAKPSLYNDTTYASAHARSASDPANADTADSGLPDGWKVKEGAWNDTLGGWNLDPSLWSSFHDDTRDADRDLVDDAVTWWSYAQVHGQIAAQPHTFVATNLVKYRAHAHANVLSSSPDGLLDSWKIFWGQVYPNMTDEERGAFYPGAPGAFAIPPTATVPSIGANDDVVLQTYSYKRYVADATGLLPGESGTGLDFTDAFGAAKHVLVVRGSVSYGMRSAALNQTNPFLTDTNGDGCSDAWSAFWSRLGPAQERVSPVVPSCAADPDGDGLTNLEESHAGTNPYVKDSDFGGVDDGTMVHLHLDPLDPTQDVRAIDPTKDSDGDIIPDITELSGSQNNGVPTDPFDPSTCHCGLLDGPRLSLVVGHTLHMGNPDDAARVNDLAKRGLVVIPDAGDVVDVQGKRTYGLDATKLDSAGDGVPDGWLVGHHLAPGQPSGLFPQYSYGRPVWWDESTMGIWKWGLAPNQLPTRDLDHDGLDDLNGEDPIPFANAANALPQGDPRDPTLTPLARLEAAQAYDGPEAAPLAARLVANVTLDPLPANVVLNGSVTACGNVTLADHPAPNATVLLALGSRAVTLGAALSDAAGHYCMPVALSSAVPAPADSAGATVFGQTDGAGVAHNDPAFLGAFDPANPVPLFAWTYNTSSNSPARQAIALAGSVGWLGNQSDAQNATLVLPTALHVKAPARALIQATVTLNATLTDTLGRPLAHQPIAFNGANYTTGTNGSALIPYAVGADPRATNLSLAFAGAAGLLPSDANLTLAITERATLEAFGPPGAVNPGASFTVQGTLRGQLGAGIPGAWIDVAGIADARAQTGPDGAFSLTLPLPVSTPPGEDGVTLRFAGDDTREPAQAEVTFQVSTGARWLAPALVASVGPTADVSATLVDATGQPIAGAPVDAWLGAKLAGRNVTSAAGVVKLHLDISGLPPGATTLHLRTQSASTGALDAPLRLLLTTQPVFRVGAGEAIRGAGARVNGSLADGQGAPLARVLVRLAWGPSAASVVTDATGSFGIALDVEAARSLGAQPARVSYAGSPDGAYLPAEATLSILVQDAPVVRAENDTVLATSPALALQVRTVAGEPLPGRTLRIALPWVNVSAVTDEAGRADVLLDVPDAVPLGPFVAQVRVAPEPSLADRTAQVPLSLKDEGALQVGIPDALALGHDLTLDATLLDSRGHATPDARFDITLDGALVARNAASGDRVPIPTSLHEGNHDVTIAAHSATVGAAPWSGHLALRVPVTLTFVAPPSNSFGAPTELAVKLSDAKGPAAHRVVLLVGAGLAPIRVETGDDGVARVPVPRLDPGSHLRVEFLGDDRDAPAGADVAFSAQATPVPGGGISWTLVALAILALAAVILVAARLLRRPTPEAALRSAARRLRRNHADVQALYEVYVKLLGMIGLSEDTSEAMTFGVILTRLDASLQGEDAEGLVELFNRAVYAPGTVHADDLSRAADAFDRLAARLHAHAGGSAS
jgi:hypothetical protein